MPHDPALQPLIESLANALTAKGWMLATAESCTGGLIAAACTDLPGSSTWFDRGFVTYSNAAKTEMLGVPADLIRQHGAVSEAVVHAMAQGALRHSHAQVSVAVTGIAGPGGGSADKPVGTVWLGIATPTALISLQLQLHTTRDEIRQDAACKALLHLLAQLD
jgi:nicotinamide-nucleotide amidase